MPKVFISYGRDGSHGENLAIEAQQQLQSAGFKVFRDVIGLKPGDVWYTKLEFELESSDVVVLVVSERVRTSKLVHNEISMAEEIGLPVIPLFAEAVRSPLWIRHLQAVHFSENVDWSHLINVIEGHIGMPEIAKGNSIDSVSLDEKPKRRSPLIKPSSLHAPSWASHAGKDQYGQYADLQINKVSQRFRLINPGTFWMGSPKSEVWRVDNEIRHRVTLSKAFWLADTACTQAFWKAVLGNNPSHFKDDKNNPVEQVSWEEVQEFMQSLEHIKSGVLCGLPTEAQWEYACRAGTTTPFNLGDDISSGQVNFNGHYPYSNGKKGERRGKTVSVKSMNAPNDWGLHEMHGNVWEWCQDWYGEYSKQEVQDPTGPESGTLRVLRGGSWVRRGKHVRSACRINSSPDNRYDIIGFRLALGQPVAQHGKSVKSRSKAGQMESAEPKRNQSGFAERLRGIFKSS